MTPKLVSPCFPAVERRGLEIGLQLRLALDHHAMARPGIGGDHDVLRRVLDERRAAAARCARRSRTALRVCDSRVVARTITGVSKVSDRSKASLVKSSASCASLGSRIGTLGERAVNARVLLVLRAVNAGIVADGEHQPAVHADIGLRHEGVGGDIEADMLHGGERAARRQSEAPIATSSATFSLVDHCACRSSAG